MRKLLVSLILLVALPLGAARDFNDATPDFLQTDTAVVTSYPFTVAGWFNSNDNTVNQVIWGMVDKDVGSVRELLYYGGDVVGDPIRAQTDSGGTAIASTSTSPSLNVWNHACGVWAGNQDRRVYLNGAGKGTNVADSKSIGAVDRTAIGGSRDSTPSAHFSGLLAEIAVWNVALTDAEVLILAAGYSPLFVRPQNLVSYWPVIGRTSPEIELIGGVNLTVTTAVVGAHPAVLYPTQPISGFAAAAAPPARDLMIISRAMKYAPLPLLVSGMGLAWVINRRNKLMRGNKEELK